jgi:hypothetical protein
MYWRLLSSDMQTQDSSTAKRIIMGTKPSITAESEKLEAATLEEMCLNVGTLATIYLKPVSQVFRSARLRKLQDSPALQRHQLPTRQEEEDVRKQMAELQLATAATVAAGGGRGGGNALASPEGAATANGAPNLAAAMDAADMYFASAGQNGYTVNQNQPQTLYSPSDERANRESLVDLQ